MEPDSCISSSMLVLSWQQSMQSMCCLAPDDCPIKVLPAAVCDWLTCSLSWEQVSMVLTGARFVLGAMHEVGVGMSWMPIPMPSSSLRWQVPHQMPEPLLCTW